MRYIFIILAILTSITIYPGKKRGARKEDAKARFSPDWRQNVLAKLFDGNGKELTNDEFEEQQRRSAANTPIKQLYPLLEPEVYCPKDSRPAFPKGLEELEMVIEHGAVRFK